MGGGGEKAMKRGRRKQESSSSFFDQIWLQHQSKSYLHGVVNTVFRAFDCDDFIKYNESTNQFEFKFVSKQNTVKLAKYVSIKRSEKSEQDAKQFLKDRYTQLNNVKIDCVNSHSIKDKDWDFEIELTLKPGRYTILALICTLLFFKCPCFLAVTH